MNKDKEMGCCECKFHALSPTHSLDHMLLARGRSLLSISFKLHHTCKTLLLESCLQPDALAVVHGFQEELRTNWAPTAPLQPHQAPARRRILGVLILMFPPSTRPFIATLWSFPQRHLLPCFAHCSHSSALTFSSQLQDDTLNRDIIFFGNCCFSMGSVRTSAGSGIRAHHSDRRSLTLRQPLPGLPTHVLRLQNTIAITQRPKTAVQKLDRD